MEGNAGHSEDDLADLAADAAARLEGRPAEEIVAWAVEEFGERFCVTSSFADALLVHVVSRVAPGVDVVFLDTGFHFAETLRVRDIVESTLSVKVVSVEPEITVAEQDAEFGAELYTRDPAKCCLIRKVEPLEQALANHDAWATGLRRDESARRAGTPVVGFERSRGKVKIAPLAAWTQADVDAYIAEHDVPVSALLGQGYTSIGCWPCTRPTVPGEDPRAGRWPLFDRNECGIHRD